MGMGTGRLGAAGDGEWGDGEKGRDLIRTPPERGPGPPEGNRPRPTGSPRTGSRGPDWRGYFRGRCDAADASPGAADETRVRVVDSPRPCAAGDRTASSAGRTRSMEYAMRWRTLQSADRVAVALLFTAIGSFGSVVADDGPKPPASPPPGVDGPGMETPAVPGPPAARTSRGRAGALRGLRGGRTAPDRRWVSVPRLEASGHGGGECSLAGRPRVARGADARPEGPDAPWRARRPAEALLRYRDSRLPKVLPSVDLPAALAFGSALLGKQSMAGRT